MNFRPFIKAMLLLGFAWLMFFIAELTFREHTTDHLTFIPANADAVVVIDNSALTGKLFEQRITNYETYDDLVSLDQELEKKLLKDAALHGVDVFGTIVIFSYSDQDHGFVGVLVSIQNASDFAEVVKLYRERISKYGSVAAYAEEKTGIILFSETAGEDLLEQQSELLFEKKFGSAVKESWFEPLNLGEHDLVAYFDSHKGGNTPVSRYFKYITPELVEYSHTFIDLEPKKMNVVHKAHSSVNAQNLLTSGKGGYRPEEVAMGVNIHMNLADYLSLSDHSDGYQADLMGFPDSLKFYPDSLLSGSVSMMFNGVHFNLARASDNGLPFDIHSELVAEVYEDYFQKTIDSMISWGFLHQNGEDYIHTEGMMTVHLQNHKHWMHLSLDEHCITETKFHPEYEPESPIELWFDVDKIVESIKFGLAPDMTKLKDVRSGKILLTSIEEDLLTFEGQLLFKRDNHTIIEVMHLLTNMEEFFGPLLGLWDVTMNSGI